MNYKRLKTSKPKPFNNLLEVVEGSEEFLTELYYKYTTLMKNSSLTEKYKNEIILPKMTKLNLLLNKIKEYKNAEVITPRTLVQELRAGKTPGITVPKNFWKYDEEAAVVFVEKFLAKEREDVL